MHLDIYVTNLTQSQVYTYTLYNVVKYTHVVYLLILLIASLW